MTCFLAAVLITLHITGLGAGVAFPGRDAMSNINILTGDFDCHSTEKAKTLGSGGRGCLVHLHFWKANDLDIVLIAVVLNLFKSSWSFCYLASQQTQSGL